MANTYLSRTFSNSTDRKKWTISVWLKRSSTSGNQTIVSGNSSNNKIHFLGSNNTLDIVQWSGSYQYRLRTSRVFRDTSAWYHLVIAVDTTLNTADNRVRLYVNGVEETSFADRNNPSQNFATSWNDSEANFICKEGDNYFDGSMSHFHFCDGTALAPTVFGSTDSTTGEWKINTSPSFTLGNNGFTILKDGNTITDQSSNSNNFTLGGGTLTKTEDNPSNNFPTLMTYEAYGANTLIDDRTNGNTVGRSTTSGYSNYFASMAATSGKYYWEFKYLAGAANNINIGGGIRWADTLKGMGVDAYQTSAGAWIVSYDGQKFNTVGSKSSANFTNAQSNNDICHIAWNATIGAWWFGVNGTWASSATDSEIAAGTVTNAVYSSLDTTRPYAPCCFDAHTTSNTHDFAFNFGNGYFATTAVASAGTNASGIGIFEYDVPAGFTALSTKGLNL